MNSTDAIANRLAPLDAVAALSRRFERTGDPDYLRGCAAVLGRVIDQPAFFNSLLWSVNRHLFVRQNEIEPSVRDEIRYGYVAPAYLEFVDRMAALCDHEDAPVATAGVERVLIVSHQFLGPAHSPTRVAVEYARTLRQTHGAEVLILNTDVLPRRNECGFGEPFLASANAEMKGEQRIGWQGVSIDCFTPPEHGVGARGIDECLWRSAAFGPTLVLSHGEFNLVGDLLATSFPTVCLPMSRLEPVSTAQVYVDYAGYYDRLRIVERGLISHVPEVRRLSAMIPSPPRQRAIARAEYGLHDDHVVFVIIGTRLQLEIDERFERALARILRSSDHARLLLIGVTAMTWRTDAMRELADRVVLRPFEADLPAAFAVCDCMLNPTRSGGGYTAVMAVDAAVPVLSLGRCDVGGVIGASNCCRDVDDLAERGVRMAQEPEYRRRCDEAARRLADAMPTFESVMGDLLRIGEVAKAAFRPAVAV